jgi:predicted nucleic acid-binding protein
VSRDKARLFWDSSAIIAAVMSEDAGRQLLRLGEAEVVEMRLSRDVLQDLEFVISKRKPGLLKELAVLLDAAGFDLSPDPNDETVDQCQELTGYRPDARVLAAALECDADLFITSDKVHFIGNPLIGPPTTNVRVTTPREALDWCRDRLSSADL